MNRLATTLAAALLVFPATAWADELPAPAVRVVSGARASASTSARVRPTTVIPIAPSRDPLARGLPRPAVTQSRSPYLRRLRGETPAPNIRTRPSTSSPAPAPAPAQRRVTAPVVRSADVSAPVRTSFPRTAARRNLTIPASPDAARAPTASTRRSPRAVASGSPDGPPRGRTLARRTATPTHSSRLPAPAVSAPRSMDTTSRRATAIRPTSRPARRTTPVRATSRPAPVRPATPTPRVAPAPVNRRALTVPTQPVAPKAEPDGARRSLLKPPAPGCEFG